MLGGMIKRPATTSPYNNYSLLCSSVVVEVVFVVVIKWVAYTTRNDLYQFKNIYIITYKGAERDGRRKKGKEREGKKQERIEK